MAGVAVSGLCSDCQRLQAEYQHATVLRLQAEADYLAAVFSKNIWATDGARRTLQLAIAGWTGAEKAFRQHQWSHGGAAGAENGTEQGHFRARRSDAA